MYSEHSLRACVCMCLCVCQQELLAVQLIRTFSEIFAEAALPLWVRHYDVLVTSSK